MFAYRIEYKGCGPFSSPTAFEAVQNKVKECAPWAVDKFGTTFINYYDQRTAMDIIRDKAIQHLIDTHPRGVLQFGFTSKKAMEDMLGLSAEFRTEWRTQFDNLLDGCDDVVVRVYEVDPIAFHNKVEVVYLTLEAKLIAEAHSAKDFLSL